MSRRALCIFCSVNTTRNVYALAQATQREYRQIFYQDAPSNASGQSKSVSHEYITCYKMNDEKIIEDVHSFPCLWQVTNKSYKDAIQQSKEQHSLSHFLVFRWAGPIKQPHVPLACVVFTCTLYERSERSPTQHS